MPQPIMFLRRYFRRLLDLLFLFALSISPIAPAECVPPPPDMVGWWRGEGNPQDIIGGNDGTEINGAGYGSGAVGRAFSFDDDAPPDYVEVPHSASLDITGPFSAEGWVNMDDLPDALIFAKGDADGTMAATSYALHVDSSIIRSVLYGTSPGDVRASTTPVDVGAWRHIAVTWDGSTVMPDNVNLYVDGLLSDTWTKTTGLNSTTESLTIGAMKPPTHHLTTDGRIDELAIYVAELTAAEVELISVERKELRLREALAQARGHYDYVLVDCPPSLNMLTVNALMASDGVLIPMQCEYYALEGLSALLDTIEGVRRRGNPDLEIEGILRTMYDPRNSLTRDVSRQLIKFFGDKVFRTVIPRNVRLAEAPSHGLPVVLYDRLSRGAVAYMALAGELKRAAARNDFVDKDVVDKDLGR